ncbi:MAG TPA: hypothetical protein DD381_04665 [Lentisphaeria bacterium]|nr:MAG: hypothetical protein A2X47_11815 [Lentisphaerae bacterium GWF2_38_69]HBM15623.1 hypothetical protein [Lentisphaeria bacterium]
MNKIVKSSLLLLFVSSLASYTAFASQELTGTVTSLDVTTHGANYDAAMEGQLGYVARLGSIGKPYITHWDNDDIVVQGIPLFQYNLEYWNSMVKGYEALTLASELQMYEAKANFLRYDKLAEQKAESELTREGYLNAYVSALNLYESNKAMIQNKYENVREATFRAPFEGIMTGVFQSTGIAAGGNVIEFTQLNPIGITIKMDRAQARKLSNKPVTIYPNSIKDAQGILYGRTLLTDDGVMFVTDNCPVSNYDNPDPDPNAIVLREFSLVNPFEIGNMNTLGIRKDSICKDDKGSFVWAAVGQSDMINPDAHSSLTFPVKKVYITPGKLERRNSGFGDIQQIEANKNLKVGDVLLAGAIPGGLKEGDKVYMARSQYVLMPGEQVKVVIGD